MFRIHESSPAEAIEEAYFRILRERMADVPVHNHDLSVEAVDFQRWQGHWLGVLVTSWHMSLMLVPGDITGWESVGDNQRRFVKFPAGDFAFLGSDEPEIGEFQSCALFSPMNKFATQSEAVLTARASLMALLHPVAPAPAAEEKRQDAKTSLSRRRFLTLR
ncbi:MAG: [NiFe]-hydrogenase assembly chaperone HybE [Rhodocyclaceae bacterium]|nr:[NiFe]-hydrogenase assembly chaperone HybE [Rhodocyclaceae bacterium]